MNTGKKTIKGLPAWQYWAEIRKKAVRKTIANRKAKRAAESKVTKKKSPKQIEVENYFSYWMRHSTRFCENCDAPIASHELFKCQAHILPKRDTMFPSVAGCIENHMTLGVACGCHHKFDSSWLAASKMRVFGIAKLRFKSFEHAIAPEERGRIPDVFTT